MKNISLAGFLIFLTACTESQPAKTTDIKIEKKTYTYKTVNDLPIKADLYRATDDRGLRPCIVWIHGGGLIFGGRDALREEQMKLYVGAGYSVVSIDYRLAPETKLPEIASDIRDAIQWTRTNGADSLSIDSTKIFVIGHSGGAYLALMSGYLLRNPPKAIVSFYGYGDIAGDWYAKPDSLYRTGKLISESEAKKMIYDSVITSASVESRLNLYLYSRQNGLWPLLVGGHDPYREKAWFDQYCPLKNISKKYSPVLLIHGDKDTDVPFEQSVLMDKELELKNVRHKFIKVSGYGHVFDLFEGGLSNPDVSKVFAEVITFLNSYK